MMEMMIALLVTVKVKMTDCIFLATDMLELSKDGLKLMKGKALRKHSLHKKTAAPVLLKLFVSSNE